MTIADTLRRAALIACLMAGVGACFEVPPLPDSEAGCVDDDECPVDEICEDAECVFIDEEVVEFDVTCRGVSQSVFVIQCGDAGVQILQCTGEPFDMTYACPVDTSVALCCGRLAVCSRERAPLPTPISSASLTLDPSDDWVVQTGLDTVLARHRGEALPDLTFVDCDVQDAPILPVED